MEDSLEYGSLSMHNLGDLSTRQSRDRNPGAYTVGIQDDELNQSTSSIESPLRKKKKKKNKFKRWLERTFCGQTSAHTTDTDLSHAKQRSGPILGPESWREALDHQLESQFVQAGTTIPSYVQAAQRAIRKLISSAAFQRQAKQDQQEFKLAMQGFLVDPINQRNDLHSFAFMEEEEKMDEQEKIDCMMREQEETDYDDVIANNLVQFEYDIFKQIKSQLQKKTNALYQICKQLAKEFLTSYSEYTLLDPSVKSSMDKTTMAHKTKKMKSTIQQVSMQMRVSDNIQLSTPDESDASNDVSRNSSNISKYMGDHSIDDGHNQQPSPNASGMFFGANDNNDTQNLDEGPTHTLSTKAVDELYVLVISFCHVIEIFFQPFYPQEVTYDLHNDLMLLSQHMLFKQQEDGRIYECMTILMRVDSQLDDKDLREKMKLCQQYSPLDFGIEPQFAMFASPADDQKDSQNLMLSINKSLVNDRNTVALVEHLDNLEEEGQLEYSARRTKAGIQLSADTGSRHRIIQIVQETIDESQVKLPKTAEGLGAAEAEAEEPYAQTIDHMKRIFKKKSAPVQKLLDLQENLSVLSDELQDFQMRHGIPTKSIGQDQKDFILRYVLMKSQIGDLFCQRTIMEEFAFAYIKENSDGNILAKIYLDFISAVDYLQSLDKNRLTSLEEGPVYMQDFALFHLKNCLYQYPDEQTDENSSHATSFNMFGGFQMSVKDTVSVQSNQLSARTSNRLKLRSMSRNMSRNYPNPSLKLQNDNFLSSSQGMSRYSQQLHRKNSIEDQKKPINWQNQTVLMDSIQEQNSNIIMSHNSIKETSSNRFMSCKIQEDTEESVQGDIAMSLEQSQRSLLRQKTVAGSHEQRHMQRY